MKESSAKLLLIFVFLSRAGAYLFSKLALRELTPFLTTGYRFTLACLLLLLLFHKRIFLAVKADKSILPKSALLGTLLFFVMFFELTGLKTADFLLQAVRSWDYFLPSPMLYILSLPAPLPGPATHFPFGSNGILGSLYIVTGLLTVNRPAKKIFPKRVETCESETSARPTVGVQNDRYQMPEPVVRD